jgi:hypothetical protein
MAIHQVPIQITAPSSNGNAYPALIDFNPNRQIVPTFVKDVDGTWFGMCRVPQNYVSGAKIVLSLCANATSGVTRITVGTAAPADAETYDVTFADETAQDIAVSTTVYVRKDVVFPATGTLTTALAPGDDLVVRITHNGANAADTLNADTILVAAVLQYSDV